VMRRHRNRITQLRVTPLGKQTGRSQAAAE
jgi:hypothetical protein